MITLNQNCARGDGVWGWTGTLKWIDATICRALAPILVGLNPHGFNIEVQAGRPIIKRLFQAVGQSHGALLPQLGGTSAEVTAGLIRHWCSSSPVAGETAPNPRLVSLSRPANWSHGVPLSCPADDLLHHAVGAGGRRRPVPGAQRTQPGVGCVGCGCLAARNQRRCSLASPSFFFYAVWVDVFFLAVSDRQRRYSTLASRRFLLTRTRGRRWWCCSCCPSCDGGPASLVSSSHRPVPPSILLAYKVFMIL